MLLVLKQRCNVRIRISAAVRPKPQISYICRPFVISTTIKVNQYQKLVKMQVFVTVCTIRMLTFHKITGIIALLSKQLLLHNINKTQNNNKLISKEINYKPVTSHATFQPYAVATKSIQMAK